MLRAIQFPFGRGKSNGEHRAAVAPTSEIRSCICCGARELTFGKVLWDELVEEWGLAPYERDYIDRQQGLSCSRCGCNLRSMALALAICRCCGFSGTLDEFVGRRKFRRLRVLEVNEAGHLTQFLCKLPRHHIGRYPELDMTRMPFPEASFDVVVHSDTLEHVPGPVGALAECLRVLSPGGFCAFTVPVVVDRVTVSREGKPPSFHGNPEERGSDLIVQTEYGCDAWKHAVLAGFRECRIIVAEFPAALAIVGMR